MVRFLKCCTWFSVMTVMFLCSCAHHKVDENFLSAAEGRTFRVGKVQGQCRMPGTRHGRYSMEEQISLLKNVPVSEIVKVLRSEYNLTIIEEDLSVKSRAAGLVGLFSESYERCVYLEGASYTPEGDAVNVLFSLENSSENGFKFDLWYEVCVESAGTPLIRHKDKVASFWQFGHTMWQTATNLQKIPEVLQKDIQRSKRIGMSKTAESGPGVLHVSDEAAIGSASNASTGQAR